MSKVLFLALLVFVLFTSVKSSVLRQDDELENRVTGGTKANPGVAKYFVSLLIEFDRFTRLCGGYIYAMDEIYTAANCVLE